MSLWKSWCGLLFLVCAHAPSARAQESLALEIPLPEAEYRWTASLEPHWLVLGPALSATLERRLTDPHAVSATVVLGQTGQEALVKLHGQYRYYIIGDFDAGVHLGGMLSTFNKNRYTDRAGIAVRGIAGAKYIFPFPMSIETQLGLGVSTVFHHLFPFYASLKVGYAF